MKFTQWLMIKEAKKPMPVNLKTGDDNLITGKVGKIGTGHQPHMSGAGQHDSRPNRERTRGGQKGAWQKDQGLKGEG